MTPPDPLSERGDPLQHPPPARLHVDGTDRRTAGRDTDVAAHITSGVVLSFDLGKRFPRPRSQQRGPTVKANYFF